MFKPIPVAIGLRYLRAKRRNGFISFISLASILGIALGVTALITTLAVMSGFQREIRDRMLQMAAHATVSGYGEPMQDWRQAVDQAICRRGRCRCPCASKAPAAADASATSHATPAGASDDSEETAPSKPSIASDAASNRDGRHSMRQGAELFDQRLEFGIVGALVSQDPAPEPIVFAVQQP